MRENSKVDKSEISRTSGFETALAVRLQAPRRGRTKVIHDNPLRLGKDELNLIEHPFAALWQKEPGDAIIFYQWEARHPVSGKVLPASWMVAGHREHGLPTASDERVYLVLMELTRESGFTQTVHFSRYDCLKRLGWRDSTQSYRMLQAAFERLQGVTINAKNAFWNPKSRSYVNAGFNIVDHFVINTEPLGRKKSGQRELPVSFFKWSDVMFDSFQSGYIRTLDLDFALALKSDIALRLYRYLDKKAYDGRGTFEIELFNLCIGHLGMKPSPFPSKLKERLKAAHDELVARGFLREVTFVPMKSKKGVKVLYAFTKRNFIAMETSFDAPEELSQTLQAELPLSLETNHAASRPSDKSPEIKAKNLTACEQKLLQRMLDIKVSSEVAQELLQNNAPEQLTLQLDCLNDREPRDAAATFVKALREGWEIPGKFSERLEAEKRAWESKTHQESQKSYKAAQGALLRAKKASQELEAGRLDTMWEQLDISTREEIEIQARQRLGVLGQSGRAQGALVAMRRNLLRERLSQ